MGSLYEAPLKPKEYYHTPWSRLFLDDLVDPEVLDATVQGSSERDC